MTKLLAIDYGLERVGLAISDPGRLMAFPLATLRLGNFGSRGALLDELARLAVANQAGALLMGLALHEDGGESLASRQARNAAERLRHRLDLPVYFISEYLSSHEAEADLRAAGLRGQRLKAVLDQQAACRILQSFINQHTGRQV